MTLMYSEPDTELFRTLLVEDELDVANAIMLDLKNDGYVIDHASTAEDALLHHSEYDQLLIDIHLRGMSGVSLVETIRLLHPGKWMALITAYPDRPIPIKGPQVEIFEKPFDYKQIHNWTEINKAEKLKAFSQVGEIKENIKAAGETQIAQHERISRIKQNITALEGMGKRGNHRTNIYKLLNYAHSEVQNIILSDDRSVTSRQTAALCSAANLMTSRGVSEEQEQSVGRLLHDAGLLVDSDQTMAINNNRPTNAELLQSNLDLYHELKSTRLVETVVKGAAFLSMVVAWALVIWGALSLSGGVQLFAVLATGFMGFFVNGSRRLFFESVDVYRHYARGDSADALLQLNQSLIASIKLANPEEATQLELKYSQWESEGQASKKPD